MSGFAHYTCVFLFLVRNRFKVCLLPSCFLIHRRDCVKVCLFGLCFLIYRKGLWQCFSLKLCFLFLEFHFVFEPDFDLNLKLIFTKRRDCFRVCLLLLCILIEMDNVRVCSLWLYFLIYRME